MFLLLMSRAFNANLYIVAATVIPVLFVAMMLPGGALARYSIWAKEVRSVQLRRISNPAQPSATRLWSVIRSHDLLRLPVTLFVAFFAWGEVCAVLALDHQHATSTEHWWVVASLVGMTVIAVLSAIAAASFGWLAGKWLKGPRRSAFALRPGCAQSPLGWLDSPRSRRKRRRIQRRAGQTSERPVLNIVYRARLRPRGSRLEAKRYQWAA